MKHVMTITNHDFLISTDLYHAIFKEGFKVGVIANSAVEPEESLSEALYEKYGMCYLNAKHEKAIAESRIENDKL